MKVSDMFIFQQLVKVREDEGFGRQRGASYTHTVCSLNFSLLWVMFCNGL